MSKNKSMRWTRVYYNGLDLSGDSRTMGELMNNIEEVELTGFSDAVHNFVAGGRHSIEMNGYQAYMNDDTERAFSVLKNSNPPSQNNGVQVLFGSGAEPTTGDPVFAMPTHNLQDTTSFEGNAGIFTTNFKFATSDSDAPISNDFSNYRRPLQKLLSNVSDESATVTSASIDFGEAKTGVSYSISCRASVVGSWVVTIQDSPDDAAWATLVTSVIDGSLNYHFDAATLPALAVDRYVRFLATRTSGTASFIASVQTG